MSSVDDSDQLLQKHDCAPPLMPEKDTSEEGAGNPTEPSEMDDEGSVDENGVTTLMKAASRNDVDAVKRYIPYQARMVARFVKAGRVEIREGTALMIAAVLGHVEAVKLLMKHERCMRSSNEYTALMWAAANGRAEVVRLLMEVEGGMQQGKGWTALVSAAYFGRLDCVKLLLEKERDIGGWPALCVADMEGHSEVVSLLESEGIGLEEPCLRMSPRKAVSERA
ncbi:Ankyrin repeat protein 1 [Giardia duodenalis]|uniref:Ankyrin repeat protein 1 n=1 Tax=Giardia intestinalis (strain ATCC 50803 / WB clone C6) TaxID=184922 RepID=A0A644F7R0_GIAIC|nr:Ankyrin repeat protein 1 [Giardia intestinalis]KAE8304669.1 Ankyrin repeat protein 1 [Giardia intestinalis]